MLSEKNAKSQVNQQLISAAYTGDKEEVEEALAQGADPRSENNMALVYAAQGGHKDIFNMLIGLVDPTIDSNSILCKAASYGRTEIISILLKDPRIDVNLGCPIVAAIRSGNPRAAELFLNHEKIEVPKGIIKFAKNSSMVKLLGKIPGVDFKELLLKSSHYRCNDLMKSILIEKENNLSVRDISSSLYLAMCHNNIAGVEILLKTTPKLVDLNVDTTKYVDKYCVSHDSLLIYATTYKMSKFVKLLLGNSTIKPNKFNDQAILIAAKFNHREVFKMIYDSYLDKNISRPDNCCVNKCLQEMNQQSRMIVSYFIRNCSVKRWFGEIPSIIGEYIASDKPHHGCEHNVNANDEEYNRFKFYNR